MLYKYQSGFCKMHSADICLSYFENDTVIGLDSHLLFGIALIARLAKWISKWWNHGRLESIVSHHGWPTRKVFVF